MNCSKKGATAADLTDDLIVEILSRLPIRSVCRFKCVSWHWYHLISHPEHRKKLPQTISGFFSPKFSFNHEDNITIFPIFDGISGDREHLFSDPLLAFLTGYMDIFPMNCCSGLIICRCRKHSARDESSYVVCNPATEQWIVLPDSGDESSALTYRLGFDPAVSPHFHVFQIIEGDTDYEYSLAGVNIYSSETGVWSHKENGWGDDVVIAEGRGVFFNGMLHLLTHNDKILAVDTEGKTWRTMSLLETMCGTILWFEVLAFIGQSQGRLYYINIRHGNPSKLSVWTLEDSNVNEWILKYSISTSQLFREHFRMENAMLERDYALIAIHPECSLLFFVWASEEILFSYDMDRGKVCVICSLKKEHSFDTSPPLYLPYVPFFLRLDWPRVEA